MGFGFSGHIFNFILGQAAGSGDGDLLLLVGAQILGGDIHDAVGVNVESDLDLGYAAGRRRYPHQMELAQRAVALGHAPFSLQHMDFHRGLIVGGRRKDLALASGDGGVALDQLGEHCSQRFNSEGERCHVQQQQILDISTQNSGLNSRADGDHLVRIHPFVGIFPEELLHDLLDSGNSSRAADQNHFVDVLGVDAGVPEGQLAGLDATLQDVFHQAFELGAGELHVQVLGSRGIGRHKRQVDLGFQSGRELHFCFFGSFLQSLQGHLVLGEIDSLVLDELIDNPVDNPLVDVVSAQVGVSVGGLDLHHAFAHFQDGDVEGAAPEIVDGDGLVFLLVQAVGQSGRGGLVDDSQNLQTGDFPRILGGLTLGVVEVGGNGDHGLGDLLSQVLVGSGLHLVQNHGRDFRRAVLLAHDRNPDVVVGRPSYLVRDDLHLLVHFRILAAHESLDGINRILRVGYRLPFGDLSDQPFPSLGEGHG